MSEVIPEGWGQKRLGEAATLIMGQSPSSHTYNFAGKGLPFFQGKADFSAREAVIRNWCSEPTKTAPAGSILFSVRAPVGETNIAPKECCIGRGLAAIIARKTDQEFLFQYLRYSKSQFEAVSQGSTFEAINGNELKEFILLHPPLPEQKKIATILSSVDNVIEKTRAQIDKLKDLKTGMMQELLTQGIGHTEFKDSPIGGIPISWKVMEVGAITRSIVPGRNKPTSLNGHIPWLTISDLETLIVNSSKLGYGVTEEALAHASGKIIPAKSVIMSVVGDFGIAAVAGTDVVINQQLHGFVCGTEIDPMFLCFSIQFHRPQLERLSAQTTIAYLNKENAESLLLALPPHEEQAQIVSTLMSIEKYRADVVEKHQTLQSLKKALMQDLLTGKVRVKVNPTETIAA